MLHLIEWKQKPSKKHRAHAPHIDGVKAIDVFAGVKHVDHLVFIDVWWQGQLDQHAVDVHVLTEGSYAVEELLLAHGAR